MEFYSAGKLLISGEYLVLDGALAFALPTSYGQTLYVEDQKQNSILWTSYDVDGTIWMQEEVAVEQLLINEDVEGTEYLRTLVKVLRAAHRQNPEILQTKQGFKVDSKLSFLRLWGLGTSSTWINNVAQWFDINPYQLLQESFGGSGYDIACAKHRTALFYQLTNPYHPKVELIEFHPCFKANLYFVYLNEKQSSKAAIETYRTKKELIGSQIDRISTISRALVTAKSLEEFQDLMQEHEEILGAILETQPVQDRLFPDFKGTIKSLGAWGGDFVLVATEEDPTAYFFKKGYPTVVPYEKMIAR
ncbi:GYDIA family GHMP kinase [Myroides sp. DW712]|uniref:GYDIA family GHMP kinase n=1 Tax=Myroides sp. DW712 TaxID=3389800 RepID=UPI003978E96A